MNFQLKKILGGFALATTVLFSTSAAANHCANLPTFADFSNAVNSAYEETLDTGFGLGMWATLMNTSGQVCYVYSVDGASATPNGGADAGNTAWLGSRVISAQKANTANAFSLDGLSIPTGAVTVATYEGGSLYGLQFSNPVDSGLVYQGDAADFGTEDDPLSVAPAKRVGGINVFGGGIALYDNNGIKVGSVGVSGDTSCRDAAMAFRLRANLGLDNANNDDSLILVPGGQPLTGLFQQPACGVNDPDDAEYFGVYVLDNPGNASKAYSPVFY